MLRNRKAVLITVVGLLCAWCMQAQGGSPPPAAGEDWGSQLVDWTNAIVNNYGGVFLHDGTVLLAWLFALKVLWMLFLWANKRALSFAHHAHYPFPLPQFVLMFVKLAILVYLLNHYMVNFPFVGFSFHSFPMAISKHIVLHLDNGPQSPSAILMQYVQDPTTLVSAPVDSSAFVAGTVYLGVQAWAGLISFGMFVLGGLGFVTSGVMTVIGPYFVALWILGGWPAGWAWNWLQVLLAVGSYRALGAVMEYIMARMWLGFIQNTLNSNTSIGNWIAHGGICVGLTLFFLLGMTMLPLFAAQIFNGAGALAQAATGAVSGVASSTASVVKTAVVAA